jgi:hypothetical protein
MDYRGARTCQAAVAEVLEIGQGPSRQLFDLAVFECVAQRVQVRPTGTQGHHRGRE